MALPLSGIRVLELGGLAPAPFCGMILRDFGAQVIRIDKVSPKGAHAEPFDKLARGKQSIAIDLKNLRGVEAFSRLIEKADVLICPFRSVRGR